LKETLRSAAAGLATVPVAATERMLPGSTAARVGGLAVTVLIRFRAGRAFSRVLFQAVSVMTGASRVLPLVRELDTPVAVGGLDSQDFKEIRPPQLRVTAGTVVLQASQVRLWFMRAAAAAETFGMVSPRLSVEMVVGAMAETAQLELVVATAQTD